MLRMTRTFVSSLALVVGAAVAAPASANAWPLGKIFHLHPAGQTQDSRIDLQVFNKGQLFQDVKVAGHVYTVLPRQGLSIKAPVGTSVYAASTGLGHRVGDLLFAVTPEMKGATISIN